MHNKYSVVSRKLSRALDCFIMSGKTVKKQNKKNKHWLVALYYGVCTVNFVLKNLMKVQGSRLNTAKSKGQLGSSSKITMATEKKRKEIVKRV